MNNQIYAKNLEGSTTHRLAVMDPMLHNTLEIKDCERIILSGTSVDIRVELLRDKIGRFGKIIINGIEFKRVAS